MGAGVCAVVWAVVCAEVWAVVGSVTGSVVAAGVDGELDELELDELDELDDVTGVVVGVVPVDELEVNTVVFGFPPIALTQLIIDVPTRSFLSKLFLLALLLSMFFFIVHLIIRISASL